MRDNKNIPYSWKETDYDTDVVLQNRRGTTKEAYCEMDTQPTGRAAKWAHYIIGARCKGGSSKTAAERSGGAAKAAVLRNVCGSK